MINSRPIDEPTILKQANIVRDTTVVFFLSVIGFTAYSTSVVPSVDTLSKLFLPLLAVERLDPNFLLTNHWSSRWGYTVPQALLHILFPGRIEAVLVFPILTAAGAIAMLFYSLSVHTNFSLHLKIAILLVLGFDTALLGVMTSGQEIAPAFLYLVLSIYFALSLEKHPKVHYALLAAFFLFLTFTCNAIFLAFAAGMSTFFLVRKDFRTLIKLGSCFVFFLLVDTLFFWIASGGDMSLGRFEYLVNQIETTQEEDRQRMAESLLTGTPTKTSGYTGVFPTLIYNLTRWRILPKINLVVLLFFVISLVLVGLTGKKISKENQACYQIHAVMALVFFALVSLSISSTHPVRPLIDLTTRYTVLFFPLALIALAITINWLLSVRNRKALIEKTSIGLLILGLGFVWGPFSPDCTVDNNRQETLYSRTFCSFFRITNAHHLLPNAPSFFLLKSHKFYGEIYRDYLSGQLSLVPPFAPSYLSLFYIIDREFPRGSFYTVGARNHRYYSRHGTPTDDCLREAIGSTEPQQNYINCRGFNDSNGLIGPAGYQLLPADVVNLLTRS